MAHRVLLREALALRLASGAISRFCFQGDTYHHLDSFDGIGSSGGFCAEHHSISSVEDSIEHVIYLGPGRTGIRHHGLQHLCGCDDREPQFVTPGDNALLDQGTFSGDISTPRSPRATITPSTTSRIALSCITASGFSNLAMSGISTRACLPSPPVSAWN